MANFTNLQSNRSGGDTLPAGLVEALRTALANRSAAVTSNIQALLEELNTLDGERFRPTGLESDSGTLIRYYPSGTVGSGGLLELRGSNLPRFDEATNAVEPAAPDKPLTLSGLKYANAARDSQSIELVGSITATPYTIIFNGETLEESTLNLNLRSISLGDANLRLTLTANLKLTTKRLKVEGNQLLEPAPQASGGLSGIQIDLRDGSDAYTLKVSGSLSPVGVNRFDSLTLTKQGDAAFGFSATGLKLFGNQEGRLSDAKGQTLGGDDTEVLFAGNDVITGTSGNDDLSGYNGNDRIDSGSGDDVLTGGAGKDMLTGGQGADLFLFDAAPTTSNTDTLRDFSLAQGDRIGLDLATFSAISGGEPGQTLAAASFEAAAKASLAGTRMLYDSKKGALLYDTDGSGPTKAVVVGVIGKGLDMAADDILLV